MDEQINSPIIEVDVPRGEAFHLSGALSAGRQVDGYFDLFLKSLHRVEQFHRFKKQADYPTKTLGNQ